MVLTNDFFSKRSLESIAARIRAGHKINYPEEALHQCIETFKDERSFGAMASNCIVGLVLAAVGLAAVAVYVLSRW